MEMIKIMLKPTVSLLGGLLLAGLCSCSNLLDELPDERVYLDTPEKIQMHLTQAYPEASFATLGEFSPIILMITERTIRTSPILSKI